MDRTSLHTAHRVLAGILAVAVLVMALFAGRALFGTWDIEVHGWIGNGVFLLVLANGGLVLARRGSGADAALALAIALLTFAQIGLGYVGRDELEAAAWHVPNGVLLMALTTWQFAALQFRPVTATT